MVAKKLRETFAGEEFRRVLSRNKVKRIALFGSLSKGKGARHSDADFLVEFKQDADLLDQVGLKLDLENLLKRDVDITTPRALSRYLRNRVLREAVYL